jgi:hypothetical protein
MKKLAWVIIIVGLCAQSVHAQQTVRGRVIDKQSQVPIIGASIILENTDPLKGDDSDIDGYFRIENVRPNRYNIRVSYLGYKDEVLLGVLVGSGQEVILTIELTESPTQLDEITVGVDRVNPTPINEMAQISGRSFTVEETKRFPVSVGDPLRLASSFAGVVATDDSDNEIVIRGNSPRGILWMLEGVEIPSPNHFTSEGASSGGISMFSTQVISRSDFLTSAFPAQYGNATSGVFDIHLRNGNNEQRETTLQFGLLGVDTSMEGPISPNSRASYLFNYRYSTLAIFSAVGLELEGENERNIFQDLSFKINVPTENAGSFSLFGLGGLSNYKYDFEFESGLTESDLERYNMGVIGLSHKYLINNTTALNTTISMSGTKVENNELFPINAGIFDNEMIFNKSFIRASSTLNKKLSSRLFTTTGVTYSLLSYDFTATEKNPNNTPPFDNIVWFDDEGSSYSVQSFTSWKYLLGSKISLVNGLHLTYFDLNGEVLLEPRSNIRMELGPRAAIFAGFGMHSKIESLEYYFGNAPFSDGSSRDLNSDLKLTRANHYVAGFDMSFKNKTYFKTEVYYQYLFNLPILADISGIEPTNNALAFSSINLSDGYVFNDLKNGGTGQNYGIEFTLEQKFEQDTYFLINASIYDSQYDGSDGVTRNTRYNGSFGYNILAGKEYLVGQNDDKILGINFKISHAGNKRYTPISRAETLAEGREVRLLDDVYSVRYANYFRADLQFSIRKNMASRTTELRIDIQNLTNRNNPTFDYFNFNSRRVEYEEQFGLIPVISYRIEF